MGRPLWRTLLAMFFVALAAHRITVASMLEMPRVLAAALFVQSGLALLTALGLWAGRRFVLAAVLALGASVVATALYASFALGAYALPAALGQAIVAALATGALAALWSREFRSSE